MSEEKTSFKFLIVSDIHENIINARKVSTLHQKSGFDYIICGGDTISVPTSKNHDRGSYSQYIPLLKNIFLELEKIAPIFWVPGNHEPYPYFDDGFEEISSKSKNINKKFVKLSDNLYLVGIGGSVPILVDGKWDSKFIPFKNIDYKNFKYAGFPYNVNNDYLLSDEELKKDFEKVVQEAKKENPNCQMIFLTHVGPMLTCTNSMEEEGENLYLGSKAIGEIFEKEKNAFLDIHGHTHLSEGLLTVAKNKNVFNPGSVQDGHYGTITIDLDSDGKWKVKEVTVNYL